MKQVKRDSQEVSIRFFIGFLFIGMGLILNEYLLTALFSEDDVLLSSSRFMIWLFDGFCIGLGLLIISYRSFWLAVASIALAMGKEIIANCNYFLRVILTGLIAILLFAQMSYMVSAIHENQDNHGIILSIDVDAGANIRTALSGCGHPNHGVLYQRLAHHLAWLSPVFDSSAIKDEKSEKRAHFSLVLISLFSMYLISFMLASLVSDEILYKLLGTLLISATILSESTWVNYVLRVHPDLLLAFFSALFLYVIYRSELKPNSKFFYLACLVGGACLSTKPIFLLFLPGLIFIEIPPITRRGVKNLIKLYLLIAVSYVILAAPFSLDFPAVIRAFLGSHSTMSTAPSWESFMDWWALLITQGWMPLVMLLVLFLVSGKNPPKDYRRDKYFVLRVWAVAISPFILLLTLRTEYGHAHWVLPFVSILLTAAAVSLPYLSFGWVTKLRSWLSGDFTKHAMAIALLISAGTTIGIVPDKVDEVLRGMIHDRKEVRTTYQLINSYADGGKKVLVETYVPYRYPHENLVHAGHLNFTLDRFEQVDPDIVALNARQLPRIMEGERPSNYVIIGREDTWKESRKYYGLFYNKSETVDPWGRKWVKTYEDIRGVQLWEKK